MTLDEAKARLAAYDAVEVMPTEIITFDENSGRPESMEPCMDRPEDADYWSVYLHQREGGIVCVCDCATTDDAHLVAAALDQLAFACGRTDWKV